MKPTKTPKPLEQHYDAALARAERDGVRVVADFGYFWLVTSSQPGHSSTAKLAGDDMMLDTFSCPCQAEHEKYLCKQWPVLRARVEDTEAAVQVARLVPALAS